MLSPRLTRPWPAAPRARASLEASHRKLDDHMQTELAPAQARVSIGAQPAERDSHLVHWASKIHRTPLRARGRCRHSITTPSRSQTTPGRQRAVPTRGGRAEKNARPQSRASTRAMALHSAERQRERGPEGNAGCGGTAGNGPRTRNPFAWARPNLHPMTELALQSHPEHAKAHRNQD